jgi:probable HAF family extracellular repeat protein
MQMKEKKHSFGNTKRTNTEGDNETRQFITTNYKKETIYMKTKLITILVALAACCAIGVSTADAQMLIRLYNVTDLGVLPAKKARVSTPAAINEQAQVTGTSGMSSVDESAFLYDPKRNKEAMEDLGRNYGGISHGFAINGVGDVVGDSTFGTSEAISHAALFRNGKIADLGTLKGEVYSRATGINASGQVVGFSGAKPDDSSTNRAFIWSASTGMLDIGTLGGASAQAFGINDSGFVTGTAQVADSSRLEITHAFIYQPLSIPGRNIKKMVDLGTLGGNDSYGMAINANNHVVGYSTLNGGIDRVHAFLSDGRKMRDLGSFDGSVSGNDQSYALGINMIDQVVGYSYIPARSGEGDSASAHPVKQVAFIYSQGEMMDLNGLIGPEAAKHYWLRAATAINNNGQIVAIALDYSTNEIHAVLLTR